MNTRGQAWALGQLTEIVNASAGTIEILYSLEPDAAGKDLSVSVSINCSGYRRATGGIPFRRREKLIITIAPNFPLQIPRLFFTHKRYGDFSHVQWGTHICLYVSPETEWQPDDGMFGFMKRVDDWLAAAAANELDPVGLPLHPPIAYTQSTFKVIPAKNAPTVDGAFWAG